MSHTEENQSCLESSGKEMDLDIVWSIEKKPVKLYRSDKEQQFSQTIDKVGKYSLALHTPDRLPGGSSRKVECLVSIYKNKDYPPQVELGSEKHINDYLVDPDDAKLIILRDLFEVHSDQNTTLVEFDIKENELPASIHVIGKAKTPFIGMRFSAKLLRNANFTNLPEDYTDTFGPESELMFKTLTIDSIKDELSRDSKEKSEAYKKGMIRPFLYLVSMHPIMRVQIADLLGIKLFEGKHATTDPHSQALLILDKHRKGLGSINDKTHETANPISKKSNWYQCLYRGAKEIRTPDDKNKMGDGKKSTRGALSNCKDPDDEGMNEIELDFLQGARDIHLEEMNKMEGETKILTYKVDELVDNEAVKDLCVLLKKHGIDRDILWRFLLEISVCADFRNWERYHNLDKDSSGNDDRESIKQKLAQWKEDDEIGCKEALIKKEESYESTNDIIAGLRSQLLKGTYDPRGVGAKQAAKKLGDAVGKTLFKYFVIFPLVPFLIIPIKIHSLMEKIIGADHPTVWMVSLQIVLQRVLLAAHDININEYYPSS